MEWKAQRDKVATLDARAKGFRLARGPFQWVTLGLMLIFVVSAFEVLVVQPFSDPVAQAIVPFILSFGAAMFGGLDRQFEVETLRRELDAEAAGRAYYSDRLAAIVSEARHAVAEHQRQELDHSALQ